MTNTPVRNRAQRRAPARHSARWTAPAHRRRFHWRIRLAAGIAAVILLLLAWATLARRFAPASNSSLSRFDAVIVLGSPADPDGNPTPEMLARVNEAVREYERGASPHLIFTGGAAHNRSVEAEVMARVAHAQGIPDSVIYMEPQARDTIENACYSVRLMKTHGWHSAEVISSAAHLPRAALIFDRMPIEWRVHPAPEILPGTPLGTAAGSAVEILKALRYLAWARFTERCEP